MKKLPLVSIIVVNWNGGKVFKDCLISLAKIDYSNWELIIVDNGSTDGSQRLPRNFSSKGGSTSGGQSSISNFQLIQNKENLGFAPANNQGFKKAKGEYVLLLNNDTKVTPKFLNKLVDKMEFDPSIGVIQPKIYMMDKRGYLDNAGSFLTRIGFLSHWGFGKKDSSEFKKEKEIFSAKGACMLARRGVINKVGLFDDAFVSYFEESDFCWRVWLAGWRVIFFPEAIISHKVGFTIRRLSVANINFHSYKNRITSLIKNLGIINLLIILPSHIFISSGIVILFLFKGKGENASMIVRAIVWNIINMPKILGKRSFVQNKRKMSDAELFPNLMVPVNWKDFYGDFRRIEEDIARKT